MQNNVSITIFSGGGGATTLFIMTKKHRIYLTFHNDLMKILLTPYSGTEENPPKFNKKVNTSIIGIIGYENIRGGAFFDNYTCRCWDMGANICGGRGGGG